MTLLPNVIDSNVLIVGGAGFVGSNLVKLLLRLSRSTRIHIIDNLLSSELYNIPRDARVVFTQGSISDDKVVNALQDDYDYIFHLATYHGNQSSIQDPLADHQNNTLTTLKLFEKVKHFTKLKKIVYSSAGCSVAKKTFDQTEPSKEVETVSLEMDSPYSISKIIGEFYSKYYHKQHQLPIVRARFQNVYGPGEILGAGQWRGTPATVWRNVVPTFVYKALKQQPLPVENEGVATRDFIYVEDICNGLLCCAINGTQGDVYNLASGKEISIAQLAATINALTNNPGGVEYLPKRDWDNSGRRYGFTEKASKEIGFKVAVPFDQGLEGTIQWTRQNIKTIEQTMAKHQQFSTTTNR